MRASARQFFAVLKAPLQVRGVLQLHGSSLQCHQLSYPLKFSKLGCIDVGVPKDGDARRPGNNLLENLQVLATQLGKIEKQSSNVASRARNARHQRGFNGIDFEVYPHDWDRRRRVLSGCQCPGAAGENHINFEPCEVERELGEKFRLVVRGSVLECDVPSLHVSCLA